MVVRMSAEFRTSQEYAKAYADKHHISLKQAEETIAVSLFKEYEKEREKHEQERCR